MAKKQKSKDKNALKDDLIDSETLLDEEGSELENLESSAEEVDETPNLEEKINDLEEALLRSRAELDNAFKRNTSDIEKAHK